MRRGARMCAHTSRLSASPLDDSGAIPGFKLFVISSVFPEEHIGGEEREREGGGLGSEASLAFSSLPTELTRPLNPVSSV